ncbi:MAG: hypothetical protein DRJ63_07820 [Thermoprotei archaeon]|nr:MAG: hypothetical protein DRJ63_07820 [Thermoprotei archaeon]
MAKGKVYLWHIDWPEEVNFIEAYYVLFLIKLAEKKLGMKYRRILDLACGIGRHHKYWREEGFEVYGVDASEEFIEIAKERNRGFEKYYVVKDMSEIDYSEEFDVVVSWYTSFGYLSHEENKRVLMNIYRALKPCGIFILDYPVKFLEGVHAIKHSEEYFEIEETKKISEYTLDYSGVLYRLSGENLIKVDELKLKLTIYPPQVLKSMLEEIGFSILLVLANRGARRVKNFSLPDLIETGIRRLEWVVYKSPQT